MKLHLHQQLIHHAVLIGSTATCMYYAKKRLKKVKKKVPSSTLHLKKRKGCFQQIRQESIITRVWNAP